MEKINVPDKEEKTNITTQNELLEQTNKMNIQIQNHYQ